MAKKINFKSKSLWKKIGLGCLCGVVGLGAIMGVGALLNKEDETTKVINPTYAIGGLTEQGAYLDTKASIYTENAFECQGLDIEMDFKNNVSYRVYFYDEDNDFLSSTTMLTSNYDENTTPIFAKYARVVITPKEDDEIKWHEKNGYAKQLTIEVNKEQTDSTFDIISENLFTAYGRGSLSAGVFTADETSARYYGVVSIEDYDKLLVKVPKTLYTTTDTDYGLVAYGLVKADGSKYTSILPYTNYQYVDDGVNITFVIDNLVCDRVQVQGAVDSISLADFNSIEVYAIK